MRKVELKMNEQRKYEIIKKLVDHNGSKKRASIKLGISIRQINRLIIVYKEKGKAGFVHVNRTHKPINAFDGDLLVTIDDKIYELKELSRNERFSKKFEQVPVQSKKKKYIS